MKNELTEFFLQMICNFQLGQSKRPVDVKLLYGPEPRTIVQAIFAELVVKGRPLFRSRALRFQRLNGDAILAIAVMCLAVPEGQPPFGMNDRFTVVVQ